MKTNIKLILNVVLFYCIALSSAGQTNQPRATDSTAASSDTSLILKRFARNFDKKTGYSKVDTKGSIVSPGGKIVGRVFYNSTYADKISNNNYRVTYTGEVIDFSGRLIGYVHPKFSDNPKGLVFEIYDAY